MVTGQKGDKVSTQRLLHPLSSIPLKFMSRSYDVNPKHLLRINRPYGLQQESNTESDFKPNTSYKESGSKVHVPWSPINAKFYEESSSDDDDSDIDDDHRERRRFTMPLTPSPSNFSSQPPHNANVIHQEVDSPISGEHNDQEQDPSVVDTS